EYFSKRYGDMMPVPNFPPEYRSGMGDEGVEELKKFVENGGALICLDEACELAVKQFKLKLKDALDGLSPKEFFCPGSTLHACFDTAHPAAYGMPADSLVFFWNSRAFEILPSGENERYEVVASYPERDILESGWLIGEEKLRRRAAMVVTRHGQGKVVLIGFRPQHRAQTHGTYKLLFNSLYS
ncbi:MAG: peptidase M14 family protein, partial [Candidatus Bathyarchaeota archaeon]|nr:peptidase M14 family protein [Candidatus Bathyarchaeota archaeon]